MQHFRLLDDVSTQGAWLTIGSFDGVHLGHQEIVKQLTREAHQHGAPAIVLTFYPHPATVLRGLSGPFYLTTPEERAELLGQLGVDMVVTHPFSLELAATSAREYILQLQQRLKFTCLWVGYDFALGRAREGNVHVLGQLGKEFGYTLNVLEPVAADGEPISSTRIRSALAAGEIEKAADWLGRPYALSGQVIHGDGRGKTIGVPTANLEVWPEKAIPAYGVYACRATLGGNTYQAATSLGVRPTFEGNASPTVEAHLLDFTGDLYGQTIHLEFIARLRDELKFPGVQALVDQIQQDIADTRARVSV